MDEQVSLRGLVAAPDTAAQLVELRQAVVLGAVDQDRVGRGNVKPVLDDRRRQEEVRLAGEEPHHGLLELAFAHRPVGDGHPQRGDELLEVLLDAADGLDSVVHEEDLAAARDLRLDRLPDDFGLARHDLGLDREAVPRRRLDDREVSQAGEREMKRARDRRRRHREHVDRGLPLLQPLLLRDAEPLLLVHDEQAQIAEGDVLAEEAVGGDQDVHRPFGDLLDHGLLLGARPQAGEELDCHREGGEPARERPEVLVREDRRRREHRDLLPVEHGLEGRAHRDLRLAVTDVAAQQPVHGLLRLHVPLDVRDRLRLVGRLLVLEGVLEFLLPGGILREGEPGGQRPAGVELQELVGHVAHRLLDGGLAARPARGAQLV